MISKEDMDKVFDLPKYEDIEIKKEYTPVELFVLHNEPAGKADIAWRRELTEAIEYISKLSPPRMSRR